MSASSFTQYAVQNTHNNSTHCIRPIMVFRSRFDFHVDKQYKHYEYVVCPCVFVDRAIRNRCECDSHLGFFSSLACGSWLVITTNHATLNSKWMSYSSRDELEHWQSQIYLMYVHHICLRTIEWRMKWKGLQLKRMLFVRHQTMHRNRIFSPV